MHDANIIKTCEHVSQRKFNPNDVLLLTLIIRIFYSMY